MIRLTVAALLLVALVAFVTLAFARVEVARDIGLVYAIAVGTVSTAMHFAGRRHG